MKKIRASKVLYIKLGEGGKWESECLKNGFIRVDYPEVSHDLCMCNGWGAIKQIYEKTEKKGVPSRFTSELAHFYTAEENVLWITFSNRKLWWGFAESVPYLDENSQKQRKIKGGWNNKDLNDTPLEQSGLSSRLTKVTGFRGTICTLGKQEQEYVLRRINAEVLPEVDRAEKSRDAYQQSLIPLIQALTPEDFETLIDMVFVASGWRRLGPVGKNIKDIDLELEQSLTKEKVFVQIKSKSTQEVLREFSKKISSYSYSAAKIFFVTHSVKGTPLSKRGIDEKIDIVGVDKLVSLVLDAGLTDWLIEKSK